MSKLLLAPAFLLIAACAACSSPGGSSISRPQASFSGVPAGQPAAPGTTATTPPSP